MFTDEYTKLEEGDVVVCTFSEDNHFTFGEEYKVIADDWGELILITENKQRFSLRPKQAGYCSTNLSNHWFYKKEHIVDNDKVTKLETGDTVVCVKSRDYHFIGGKEYKVTTDSWGEPMLITEMSQRYALKPKQGSYCSTNLGEHWFRKKEKDMDKEFKEGDVVVCVKTRDEHFIEGKEYKVHIDNSGNSRIITESLYEFYLRPKQGGYCSTNLEKHWFRKKDEVMGEEFKEGDWVFETKLNGEVSLEKLVLKGDYVCTGYECYNSFGINEKMPILQLVRATSENRKALVTLYGEETIPKLELTGGEAVKHLLGLQKWVLCQVSNISETHARVGNVIALIDCADTILPFGSFYDGGDDWDYAVPIDMNGEEITISLVGWD